VPKRTPKEIVGTLNAAVVDALAAAPVRARLAEPGVALPPREQQTPEALRAFQRAEVEKWWPIIKAANVRGEQVLAAGRGRGTCRAQCGLRAE